MKVARCADGGEIVAGEVIVSFKAFTDNDEIYRVIESTGGHVIDRIPALGVWTISVPENGCDSVEKWIRILELERSWWTEPGPKEVAITERLELSTSRYYELLNELLDRPEAEAHDPLVVRRLRRMRDRRRRSRVSTRTMNKEQSR